MDKLHTILTRHMEDRAVPAKTLERVAAQNRAAAESPTAGELYLDVLNIETARTAFSSGAGACQVREFPKGGAA